MVASQIQDDEPRRFVMSAPIPLRQDFDASQLRGLARRSKDGPRARRLLALAAIYDGATRTEVAKIGGVCLSGIWLRAYKFSDALGSRLTRSVPTDSLLKVNLTGQVVTPPGGQHLG